MAQEKKTEWCDYEPGDFDSAEFYDSPHGRLHLRQPLHNTAGQTFGTVFDLAEEARRDLSERFGGRENLQAMLGDE